VTDYTNYEGDHLWEWKGVRDRMR